MPSERRVAVGRIGRPHGIHGEVRVDPLGTMPRGLEGYTRFYLEHPGGTRPIDVEAVRPHGRFLLLRVRGVDTPEAARALTNGILYVDRDQMPPLGEGEYYHADLMGCRVVDDAGRDLGRVDDVFEAGGYDVLVIRDAEREWMLPVLERWVPEMDLEQGVIVVRPPEGLWA